MKISHYLYIATMIFIIFSLCGVFILNNKDREKNPRAAPTFEFRLRGAHKTLYLDRTFNTDEVNDIVEATLEWSQATHGNVVYDVKTLTTIDKFVLKDAIVVNKVTKDNPNIVYADYFLKINGSHSIGYWKDDDLPSILLVKGRLTKENYKTTVMHEMGHSLGLAHIPDPYGVGTLMYHGSELSSDFITPKDMEQYCKYYYCNFKL